MARRRGRSRGLPPWWRGRKLLDDIDGSEHFELDSNMMKQRGLNIHRKNFDTLTDLERAKELNNS